MKLPKFPLGACLALLFAPTFSHAQNELIWEAYNDYRPGDDTAENVSDYDLRVTDDGGPLIDFATGDDLDASVLVESDGTPDDFGLNFPVEEDSPAGKIFTDIVTIGNDGLPGLRGDGVVLTILFQDLDPTKRYNFRGTTSRGGNYDDRWSVFEITGTDGQVNAHVDGSDNQNLITGATFPASELEDNQVALNGGHNTEGSLIAWDNIEPGDDGQFEIVAVQYFGEAPFGDPSAGPYGYGFSAIYLAAFEATGELRITENPTAGQIIPAGQAATLEVLATSPSPITFQWQAAAPGEEDFADIAGATDAEFVTPALAAVDSGTTYRCVVTSDGNQAISGSALVEVDGTVPTVSNVEGSVNFNAVYVSFSEPMQLAQLAVQANYTIGGGLTISGVEVVDTTTVRLLTSDQPLAGKFSLTVKDVEDLAGNKVDAAATEFASFSLANGVVGLEIWQPITGSAVENLTDNGDYPDNPSIDFSLTAIDSLQWAPDGPNNTYGARFRAWLIPKESGDYHFHLRADDNGEFHIAPDAGFGGLDDPLRSPEAFASGNMPFQEPDIDDSTSEAIALEAGKKYAVQVIWKEGNGGDRAQLAWSKVGENVVFEELEPIPSEFFCYFGPGASDADNDGMSDVYEALNGLNTAIDDGAGDLDGDGITNKQEHDAGTSANSDDSDGDGLKDGVETGTGTWVSASNTGTDPLSSDSDADGLGDGVETRTGVFVSATDTGTDPLNRDTDNDGARDGLEVSAGFDPHDPNSIPSSLIGGGTFTTEHVWTDGDPAIIDLFSAEEALDDPGDAESITAQTEFIQFHDSSEPPFYLDQSLPFPLWDEANGGDGFGDRDSFAIRSTGQINLVKGGLISFICNSDDGFSLTIDGEFIDEAGDRGRADTLMEVDLDAGVHDIEFLYYENAGGAGVSLYIYRGTGIAPDLSEEEWELVRAFGGGADTFEITEVAVQPGRMTITWPSKTGETFLIQQGTTLDGWSEVTDGHPSGGDETSFELELDAPQPETMYIRVMREE